jgi:hypothetical protein
MVEFSRGTTKRVSNGDASLAATLEIDYSDLMKRQRINWKSMLNVIHPSNGRQLQAPENPWEIQGKPNQRGTVWPRRRLPEKA